MKEFTIDVIIPTYRPGKKYNKLIEMLKKQTYPMSRILIMNTKASGSPGEKDVSPSGYPRCPKNMDMKDASPSGYPRCPKNMDMKDASPSGYPRCPKNMDMKDVKIPGAEVYHLTPEEFDHGGTRDRAAMVSDGELMLFMTQDAVPADEFLIERLAALFNDPEVDAAYARQLPDKQCDAIERYTRSFNYPDKSSVRSKIDLPIYGIKTFFCSNVCAMYRKSSYEKIGGFEKHTIFNEDMIFAGKIIRQGGSIAYVAEAKVIHSHNYGMVKQLKRNFDLAVSQADHSEIFSMASSESEGIRLVKQTGKHLISIRKPWLIPKLIASSGFKFLGYCLGKNYKRLPKWLVMRLTMNQTYWKSWK